MKCFGLVVLWAVGAVALRCSVHPRFPSRFKFGVSTSSYQVEGAWKDSDKGVNIYDTFTHNTPGAIKDNSTGDVACDSYHLWKRDAQYIIVLNMLRVVFQTSPCCVSVYWFCGTYDFFAFNYYTIRMVRKPKDGEVLKPYPLGDAPEIGAKFEKHPAWETAASAWLYVDPEGLRHQLVWLKKKYGNIKFFITENGYSSKSGLDDQKRVDYHKAYLKQLLLAIKEDGVDVTGYSAWTLMDNFEWMDGYSMKFGLYQVDFSSAERNRTARLSALFYKSLIERQLLKNEIRDEL